MALNQRACVLTNVHSSSFTGPLLAAGAEVAAPAAGAEVAAPAAGAEVAAASPAPGTVVAPPQAATAALASSAPPVIPMPRRKARRLMWVGPFEVLIVDISLDFDTIKPRICGAGRELCADVPACRRTNP